MLLPCLCKKLSLYEIHKNGNSMNRDSIFIHGFDLIQSSSGMIICYMRKRLYITVLYVIDIHNISRKYSVATAIIVALWHVSFGTKIHQFTKLHNGLMIT